MRALAPQHAPSRKQDVRRRRQSAVDESAAQAREAARRSLARPRPSAAPESSPLAAYAHREPAPLVVAEPPAETDAWWLTRSEAPTFVRRTIPVPAARVRSLRARGDAAVVVEFNGETFEGAVLSAREGRYELDLGDALAQAMAEALDEDDGLDVRVIRGRARPTLSIDPFVAG